MNNYQIERIAKNFVLLAVQEWGQPEAERIEAVQAVLDAAGFHSKATTFPVFGGIWKSPCIGPDAALATAWLEALTETMPRGKFERESDHVASAIKARVAEQVAS